MTVLVELVRNGRVESVHSGTLVLLDPDGAVERSAGDLDPPVLPRSALKPLQAVALLEHGYSRFQGELPTSEAEKWAAHPGSGTESVALAAASHDGEDVHIAGARAILAAAGLGEEHLQCPAALPSGPDALLAWVGAGGRPAAVCHNCSGKHAAMLATCVAAGWPVETYREPSHPLQVAIRERIGSLAGAEVSGVAVDGCGAPAFALGLVPLARAFAVLARADDGAPRQVADAMRAHPRLVGGTGRAVTELLAAVPGLVAKEGAEGVWAAALPDGRAFAAKLADGSSRALPPLLCAALSYWGLPAGAADEVVARWSAPAVLGAGQPVGEVRASADLRTLLAP